MDTQSVDGHFNDGSVGNHGRNPDSDCCLLFDHSLGIAINAGKKPITSRTAALGTGIKHRNGDGNSDTSGRFLRRKNHFNI